MSLAHKKKTDSDPLVDESMQNHAQRIEGVAQLLEFFPQLPVFMHVCLQKVELCHVPYNDPFDLRADYLQYITYFLQDAIGGLCSTEEQQYRCVIRCFAQAKQKPRFEIASTARDSKRIISALQAKVSAIVLENPSDSPLVVTYEYIIDQSTQTQHKEPGKTINVRVQTLALLVFSVLAWTAVLPQLNLLGALFLGGLSYLYFYLLYKMARSQAFIKTLFTRLFADRTQAAPFVLVLFCLLGARQVSAAIMLMAIFIALRVSALPPQQ